jgi:putative transposase
VSISLEVDFCLDALDEALARHGRPAIFNTDQGSQFTSKPFTRLLSDNLIRKRSTCAPMTAWQRRTVRSATI